MITLLAMTSMIFGAFLILVGLIIFGLIIYEVVKEVKWLKTKK